jgi:low affinity Fe/Cu permease
MRFYEGRYTIFKVVVAEFFDPLLNFMKNKDQNHFTKKFETIASKITKASGSPFSVICAILLVVIWAISGPVFNFSENWQLVINTGTTIITFIMVFIIQQSQNKDTIAIQIKLNELVASSEKASNRVVNVEDLTEKELEVLKKFYQKLSDLSEKDNDIFTSHSIDEAEENHDSKRKNK